MKTKKIQQTTASKKKTRKVKQNKISNKFISEKFCPVCGIHFDEQHCRLICPNCGASVDCSDPI